MLSPRFIPNWGRKRERYRRTETAITKGGGEYYTWSRVGAERAVPAARLAAFFDLPAPYLNKQLQALARAGIVTSTPGPRGGFRLARVPSKISLPDVVVAIEGPDEAFAARRSSTRPRPATRRPTIAPTAQSPKP